MKQNISHKKRVSLVSTEDSVSINQYTVSILIMVLNKKNFPGTESTRTYQCFTRQAINTLL